MCVTAMMFDMSCLETLFFRSECDLFMELPLDSSMLVSLIAGLCVAWFS